MSLEVNYELLHECPGEAHELDCTFNPSFQGPYGPGYHNCDICSNEGYVDKETLYFYLELQLKRAQEKEQQLVIDALMKSVPMLHA